MQHRLWFGAVALAAAALDLWTKSAAFGHIPEGGSEVPVIPGFFSFGRTTNTGIVFGLFGGAGPVFLIVSVLAVPAILFIFLSVKNPRWVLTASLALILGGTLGNMYDRVIDGHVRDFIKFYWGQKVWPLFNLADSCICVGVLLLSLEMLFFDDKKAAKAEDPALSTERIAVGETEPMPRADEPEVAAESDPPPEPLNEPDPENPPTPSA